MDDLEIELRELKIEQTEIERKIKKLENRLSYKTVGGILEKIHKLYSSILTSNLEPCGITLSSDVNKVLEDEFVWKTKSGCMKCNGQSYILDLPVKVDKSCYEYISIEVRVND